MNNLVMSRRRFIIWFDILKTLAETNKEDVMFLYYVNKNILHLQDEYNCLKFLEGSLAMTPIIKEFFGKKQKLVDKLKSEGVTEKFEYETEYKDLVVEYSEPVKKFDINCNTVGSFLHDKSEYTYYPIPYRYIPKQVNPLHFEFLFKMIEEDLGVLLNKYGK